MFDSHIEEVRVKKYNLDWECYSDFINGKGIRLTSPEAYHQKEDKYTKKKEKVYNGLQSEFFGTDFGDETEFQERWSCKCKKYVGFKYKNFVCEVCNRKVEFYDNDLRKFGWVILDDFKVISPIYAEKLKAAFGNIDGDSVLKKILEIKTDENGDPEFTDKELVHLKKHPFIHKGMLWFRAHFMEVLDYYENLRAKTNKSLKKLFNEIRNEYLNVFTSCLPVYSAVLRTELPGEKGGKLFKLKINTHFQALIKLSNYINAIDREEYNDKDTINSINSQLAAMQLEIECVFETEFKSFTKKSGIIYSKVIGGRYNFSARNIITPSFDYIRADEVEFSYSTFLELYRNELINLYHRIHNCTLKEASMVWQKATVHFDETMYNIMQFMVTDKDSRKYMNVLISRNPCRLCTA